MQLPPDHPQRIELSEEIHARPPEPLKAPSRVSYMALMSDPARRDQDRDGIGRLAARYGCAEPPADANHYRADLGPFRLRWERHTEFSRLMVLVDGLGRDPFEEPALDAVPADWLASLPGELMVASHGALVPAGPEPLDLEAVSARWFSGDVLVGSAVAGGAALALTDFRIGPDGFSRFVIEDRGLTPRQAGRIVQRLLEIDTYKAMALLAFPVAKRLSPFLSRAELEIAAITTSLVTASDEDEGPMLDRLTRLQAEIESRASENHFRFGAGAAYHDLVQRRIADLRETRIRGVQTFDEFIERRLAPAMSTCRAANGRQDALAGRVARATQLLSTRVDVTQAAQNQELLRSMNRRAQLQLRLQQTVEGLSVAAVTYYIVGLVSYAAKGLTPLGARVDPEIVVAASIPLVLGIVWLGVRRIRRSVTHS